MKQKLYYILIPLLVAVVSIYVLVFYVKIPSKILQPLGQSLLKQLGDNLERKVNATEFYTNFINRFYLENFVIYSSTDNDTVPLIESKSLTVNYRLWDLILNRQNPEKSVSNLVLNSAKIYITNRYGDWNFMFPQKEKMKMTLPKILFHDSTIQIEDITGKIPALLFTNMNGYFYQKNKNLTFKFSGKTDPNKKTLFRIEGNTNIDKDKFVLELKGKNIDLALAGKHLIQNSGISHVAGLADGKFEVKGERFVPEDFKKWDYQGTTVIRKGELKLVNVIQQPLSNINGEFDVNNQNLTIKQLQVNIGSSTVKLTGNVNDIFNLPRFLIKLNTELNVKDLISLISSEQVPYYEGKTNVNCSVHGTTVNYVLDGNVHAPWLKYQGWKLENISAGFGYRQSKLSAQYNATFFSGTVQGTGLIENNKILFKGQAKNVDLGKIGEKIAPSSDTKPVSGFGTANYQLSGSLSSPKLDIVVGCNKVLLWNKEKIESVKLGIESDNYDKLIVQVNMMPQNYNFNLVAGYGNHKETDIKELVFSVNNKSKAVVKGKIGVKNELNLSVQTDRFNFTDIPYFNQYYTTGKGYTKLNGEIKGTISNPETKIVFTGEEELLGKFSGSLDTRTVKEKIEIDGKIESRNGGFENLKWETLEASVTNLKKDITNFKLAIKQKEGKLLVQAELQDVPSQKKSEFHIEGNATKFGVNNSLLTSKFSCTGLTDKNSLNAVFNSPSWFVNSESFGIVEGKIEYNYEKQNMQLSQWSWGENILVNCGISFVPKEERINGRVVLRSVEWKDLEKMVLPGLASGLKGIINGEAAVWGNLYSPQSKGNVVLQNGEFQKKDIGLQIKYNYNRKVLQPEIEISSKDGLNTTVTGKIIYAKTGIRSEWQANQIMFGDMKLKSTKAELLYSKNRINILSLAGELPSGTINILKNSYIEIPADSSDKDIKFVIYTKLRNVVLANMDLWGGLNFDGKYSIISDNIPNIETKIKLKDFWCNQYNIASAQLLMNYAKDVVTLIPTNDKVTLSGKLDLSGKNKIVMDDIVLKRNNSNLILARGELDSNKWNFSVEGDNLPAEVLVAVTNFKIPSSGTAKFHLLGSGNKQNPVINGSLEISDGSCYNISFDNLNMLFAYRNDTLYLKNLYAIANKKFNFNCKGEFPLPSEEKPQNKQQVKLSLKLDKGDLSMLAGLSDKITRTQGLWEFEGEVGGTVDDPRLKGMISVYNGEIQLQDFTKKISGFNAEIILSEKDILFQRFDARVGKSMVQLSGKITLAGLKVNNYDLALKTIGKSGSEITLSLLSIPQSTMFKRIFSTPSKGDAKVDLTLTGSAERPVLKGIIELSDTHFTFPPMDNKKDEFIDNLIKPIYWDLVIKTGQNVWYENELVSINTKGMLSLTGKTDNLKVNGGFESLKGELNYLGRNFDVKRARFEVIDSVAYLEGSAETQSFVENKPGQAGDKTIPSTIVISIDRNKLDEVRPKFSSKERPDLSSEKVVTALVMDGKSELGSLTPDEQMNLLRRELVHWIDSSVVTPLTKMVLRQTGMDFNLRVTQDPGTTKNIESSQGGIIPAVPDWFIGTNITFERNITDQTQVGYSLKLRKGEEIVANPLDLHHEIELTQRWKNIVLKGSVGFSQRGGSAGSASTPVWETERKISVETQEKFGWDDQ